MCGLVGFIDLRCQTSQAELETLARVMANSLVNRGPDDRQVWADAEAGIAIGFRRLAVIDLSEAGRQPMVAKDGRYVIAYNGEVYNAGDIRRELEGRGVALRGHSDTEVILEACVLFGIEQTIRRLIGMFAIALWDRRERTLTLARDRLGKKPLYWGRIGSTFFFGSQPKSFFSHPNWRAEIDHDSLALYLRFNNVPAPRSIFRNIAQLAPGSMIVLRDRVVQECRYWSAENIAEIGVNERLDIEDSVAIDKLHSLLEDAVRMRMVADVPLGAFLSGGINSSTVVALMQAQSGAPIKTFSIGYTEQKYDEAPYARAVARHLGTDHHELYVRPEEAMDVIPKLADFYDEPFANSSQIPTLIVSALARRHVTVSLSGDGGDELFAGYPRYRHGEQLTEVISRVPGPLRPALRAAICAFPAQIWDIAAQSHSNVYSADQYRRESAKAC